MGRIAQFLAVMFLGFLGLGSVHRGWAARSQTVADGEITVRLYNDARVPEEVLRMAEQEASRIFAAAGVESRWLNCGGGAKSNRDCRQSWGQDVFVMHIVGRGAAFKNDVFGIAFLAPGSQGKYCDVFYDRIQRMHTDSNVSLWRLLGHVAAHELGHLLLGSNSHAPRGIMSAQWREEEVRRVGMGALFFTPEQATSLRSSVRTGGSPDTLSATRIAGN